MIYARIFNAVIAEYPVYENDIKQRFFNTSFTIPFIAPDNYAKVENADSPDINWDQNITEGDPKLINGSWTRTWIVTDATAEQISERTKSKGISVRNDRNRFLVDCDWTQLPDAPVPHALWATYRQQLRDVTAQAGFPWEVVWPEAP